MLVDPRSRVGALKATPGAQSRGMDLFNLRPGRIERMVSASDSMPSGVGAWDPLFPEEKTREKPVNIVPLFHTFHHGSVHKGWSSEAV